MLVRTVGSFCLGFSVGALAQVPSLVSAPPENETLQSEFTSLQSRLRELQAQGAQFNAECNDVKAGSAADFACERRQEELERLRNNYVQDADRYNDEVGALRVAFHTEWPKAQPLPQPNWDCFCTYRYVTRPNGHTLPTVLRTPEQQRAYDLLVRLGVLNARLTELRQKYFATDTATIISNAALKHALSDGIAEALKHYALPEFAASDDIATAKKAFEVLNALLTGKEAMEAFAEWREWQQVQAELKAVVNESGKTLDEWHEATLVAQNVPAFDSIVEKPYTIVFTNGEDSKAVAVVTRSPDGIRRALTVAGPFKTADRWDGR